MYIHVYIKPWLYREPWKVLLPSTAKPEHQGIFVQTKSYALTQVAHYRISSNRCKLFGSACVYRPIWMNSSACTCRGTFLSLGFEWLWLEQSWQYTILPIYSVDYTPPENWCQLICHFGIFSETCELHLQSYRGRVSDLGFCNFLIYFPQISRHVCPGLQPLSLALSCE